MKEKRERKWGKEPGSGEGLLKGTVNTISSDPPCNARFTMVPLKA